MASRGLQSNCVKQRRQCAKSVQVHTLDIIKSIPLCTQYAWKIFTCSTRPCAILTAGKKTRVRRARGGLYKYLRKNGNLSNPRPAPTFLSCEGAPGSSRACALGHIPRVLPSPWSELIPLRRPRWDDRGPWTFPAFLYSPWTRSRQR